MKDSALIAPTNHSVLLNLLDRFVIRIEFINFYVLKPDLFAFFILRYMPNSCRGAKPAFSALERFAAVLNEDVKARLLSFSNSVCFVCERVFTLLVADHG